MLCFHFCVEFDVKGADRLTSIDYFLGHGLFFSQRRVTVLQCVSPLAACQVYLFFLFSQGSCVKWVNCFTSHVSLQWHVMLLLCLLCPNMSVNARNQQGHENKISVGRSSVTKKWIINHRSQLELLHELVKRNECVGWIWLRKVVVLDCELSNGQSGLPMILSDSHFFINDIPAVLRSSYYISASFFKPGSKGPLSFRCRSSLAYIWPLGS